eukprot:CAMPEP_0117758080 /NCGR_PEP_ID=MMETSP0947-20121206/15153_1 /TAXON_ID=44440 /ORGANISM="Chattonella subsalsa, Strain CCMP2191" /LENGTH=265 /DNA_ID=CAMNT_0005578175 /DNA_START=230 /DNA_END=1024 /DNA_ORIENTATION=+
MIAGNNEVRLDGEKKGSKVKEKTKLGVALWLACVNGHVGQAAMAIKQGADPTFQLKDLEGNTAIHGAALFGRTQMLEYLLSKGGDDINAGNQVQHNLINLRNGNSQTPLHLVCKAGKMETACMLLEKGANVGSVDANGDSPLHLASKNGHPGCVALLLEAGANVKLKNNNMETPEKNVGNGDGSRKIPKDRIVSIKRMLRPSGYAGRITVVYERGAVVREGEELDSQIVGSLPEHAVCHSFGSYLNSHGVQRYLICNSEHGLVGW